MILEPGRGRHRKSQPWAFTEHGVAMLSSVLSSPKALAVNIQIMRAPARNPTTREDSQSVGSVVTFGQFWVLDLGDLPWNQELELMCPTNPIGAVDLYMVSVHGLAGSGSEALVHGVSPRVAVTQNSPRR